MITMLLLILNLIINIHIDLSTMRSLFSLRPSFYHPPHAHRSYLPIADDVEAMPAPVSDGGLGWELQGQRS